MKRVSFLQYKNLHEQNHAKVFTINRPKVAPTRMLFLLAFALLFSGQAWSQNLDEIYTRLAGEGNYTKVSINGTLFQLAASLSDDPEAEIAKGIEGITILSADRTKDKSIQMALAKEIKAYFIQPQYAEFMTVDDGKERVYFYMKNQGEKLSELALFVEKDATTIRISGDLNLADMAKLSKSVNFKGMENLDKLDKK